MDRIPAEILCNIFFESIPNRDEVSYDAPLSVSIASPLYFSHVCQRWREITLATGRLWSHLCIKYSDRGERKLRKNIKEVFNTWLKRTRGCPLNFCFWFSVSRARGTQVHSVVGFIVKTLLSEQHRWRDVDFQWYHIRLSSLLPKVKLTNMPVLSSLIFFVTLDAEVNNIACISLAKSSRLEHLDLRGDYRLEVGKRPALAMMKTVSLMNPRSFQGRSMITVCLDFLRLAPNLQGLKVSYLMGKDHVPSSSESDEPVPLWDLRSLHLDLDDNSSLVVDKLYLPALTELHIRDGRSTPGAENLGESLLYFLQRSSPPLTRLSLDLYGGTNVDLSVFLGHLPALEEIHLFHSHLSIQLFQALSLKDPSDVVCLGSPLSDYKHIVCPRLRVLHISSGYMSLTHPGRHTVFAFRDMILSRWEYATASRVLIDGAPFSDVPSLRNGCTQLAKALIRGKDVLIEVQSIDP